MVEAALDTHDRAFHTIGQLVEIRKRNSPCGKRAAAVVMMRLVICTREREGYERTFARLKTA